ncbi:MAG: binding protein excisionase family [Segetibacter sp.]|nr:binding protein excisionase family [Segetibacter sp.]
MLTYQVRSEEALRQMFRDIVLEVVQEVMKPNATDTELLTRKQAADFLKVSLPTLAQYTKEQIIAGRKCGNKVLYRKDDLLNCGKIIQSLKYKKRYE